MAGTTDLFNFENRLIRRLDELSDLGDSLPVRPISAPKNIPTVHLQGHADEANSGTTNAPSNAVSNDADLTQTSIHKIKCAAGDVWIQGNTLLCSCPDCKAPMTIRIWLGLADCWRCSTSITLTEEQAGAAQQLAGKTASRTALPAPIPIAHRQPVPDFAFDSEPATEPVVDSRRRELEELTRGSFAANAIRRGFSLTPAWLVSFLLHLIAILILALIVMSDAINMPETITLSTFLSSQQERGGQIRMENPLDALQDDLELASDLEAGEKELRAVLQKAERDAAELVTDPQPLAPLPDINIVKQNITIRPDKRMSFAARDPRVRAEIVKREGGTTITEAAVARGLRWLASVQNRDGSWSLKNYSKHDRPKNSGDVMGTSLALLPMLGAGQTHEFGAYKHNVAGGLAWLIENQKPNGDLRAGYKGQAGMYAHGQATIVLVEALALTGDQKFRMPALRAIKFIELAQHGKGGWRYQLGQIGDTSVFGWQMMALQSARSPQLNLDVDPATLKLAELFLDQVQAPAHFDNRKKTPLPDGAAYCYQPGRSVTAAMTAEAILCRMYLGWDRRDPRIVASIKWLINDHFPSARAMNLYYWYYGTQVMHHYGGDPWNLWNNKMRELLISTQESKGRHPGSWDPGDFEWGNRGGRIYTTSLAVCTLEVYYRHLPLFKQIEFASDK